MKWKITKLDRRYNGHKFMKYAIETTYDLGGRDERIKAFKNMRVWLWENYGPGAELKYIELQVNDTGIEAKERWAWDTEHGNERMYLKSDEEMTFFKMKF